MGLSKGIYVEISGNKYKVDDEESDLGCFRRTWKGFNG